MPIFMCRWPNGDLSIVEAADMDEAVILLDEIADASCAEIHVMENLLLDFRLEDDGSLQLEQWGFDAMEEILETAYPQLDKAFSQACQDEGRLDPEIISENIRAAVELERERIDSDALKTKAPQARTELGRKIQKRTGAPAALINRMIDDVGTKILEEIEPYGEKN